MPKTHFAASSRMCRGVFSPLLESPNFIAAARSSCYEAQVLEDAVAAGQVRKRKVSWLPAHPSHHSKKIYLMATLMMPPMILGMSRAMRLRTTPMAANTMPTMAMILERETKNTIISKVFYFGARKAKFAVARQSSLFLPRIWCGRGKLILE